MKKFFTLACLLFISITLFSQILPRKGSLGVLIKNQEDGKGVLMEKVFPSGTAYALGVKDMDILISANGKAYNDVGELVALTQTWKEGNPVSVKIKRGNKILTFKGKIVGKPKEQSEYGEVIYGAVNYDGGMLRSILEVPNGVKNPPVMFFLPGIGCGSLDKYYDAKDPLKQLIEGLVQQGIAVYRVDKPGMGDGEGTQECLEMDYQYEVDAFLTALRQLKTNSKIDANNIFLYGHSLGGLTAPLIAEQEKVKGILAWGSISTSWYEYYLKILRDQKVILGEEYETIEEEYRATQPFIYDFYVNQKSLEELKQIPEYKDLVADFFGDGELYHGMHHWKYVQQLNKVNLTKAWKNVNCDVLAIYGEHDLHAIDSDWAKNIAEVVNYYNPGKGNWKVIPKINHHYVKMPSYKEYNRVRREGINDARYRGENFNSEIIKVVSNFIKEVVVRA